MRAYFRILSILLLSGVGFGLLAGCAMGGVPLNYYLDMLIKDTGGDQFANTGGLIVRLANGNAGLFDEEVDLLISYRSHDGSGPATLETVTLTCRADEVVCDLSLDKCPVRIEAFQERQYDTLGRFQGSRDLDGNPDFIFEEGDYECGGFVVYLFSETQALTYAY